MQLHLLRRWMVGLSALLAVSLPAFAADDPLTPPQKSAIDQMIHDYLLNHPDVLIEAVKTAQQKNEAMAAEMTQRTIAEKRQELVADPNAPVGGNPKGDATIVEFFDYRCPYCKEVEPSLEALLKEDPQLRIVYKEFPVLGQVSVFAARVAFAARKQGKYGEFHRLMMGTKGTIDNDVVLHVAAASGLDLVKLKADMTDPQIDTEIKANYALAEALGIEGTPAFIVGDTLTPGAVDIDTLRQQVATLRKGG
jgi:protein-disulfide isomerase